MSEMETARALSDIISQPAAAGALFAIALQLRALRSEAPAWIERVETATERVVNALAAMTYIRGPDDVQTRHSPAE